MSSSQLYDDDIYAWSEQQAAVLRRMAGVDGRLPNELDLENVAEEIESVGRSERHAAESALRLILSHLIKLAAAPDATAVRHWRKEIVSFHIELLSHLTPSMAGRINMHRLWKLAQREARASLEEEMSEITTELLELGLCPLDLEAVTSEEIDIDDALSRLSRG